MSYDDEWDDGTNATKYCDIDDHNAVDNDGSHDECDEPEDHEGEWIDMSGIPEDATFEEPAERGQAGVSGEARRVGAKVSPVMF